MSRTLAVLALIMLASCGGNDVSDPESTEGEPAGFAVVLPVTFADGVTVALVYPAELALERLEPMSSVILAADARGDMVRRDVVVTRSRERPKLDGSEGSDYLLLPFEEWEALVSVAADRGAPPLTAAERSAWAEDLAVQEAATGFPVVVAGPRLRLAPNPDDETAPVELLLGADLEPGVALTRPSSCAATVVSANERCHETASVLVSAYGDPAFVDAVRRRVTRQGCSGGRLTARCASRRTSPRPPIA